MSELKIVFVGHVDHGKSTIIGRLLYDTKSLPQGVVDKVQRIADETGKNFEFAYLLDAFAEERQQGITIDMTQLKFSTPRRAGTQRIFEKHDKRCGKCKRGIFGYRR